MINAETGYCSLNPKIKHGLYGIPLYKVWSSLKVRCSLNTRDRDFKYYGAKGITVCEEWKEFLPFYNWCMNNNWVQKMQIDRIDGDKGYSPENCRIVTVTVNANNRSNNVILYFNGESKTIAEWSREIGIKYTTIRMRLLANWPIEKVLSSQKFISSGKNQYS